MSDRNVIGFICAERGLTLYCQLGEAGARLTGGVGGLTTEALPRDTDVVLFGSHPPYGQTIALMLDGYAERRSVADELHMLYVMARALPGEPWPPTIRLDGNARRKDLPWLIADLDADESTALARADGALTRIAVTVTLLQDRRPAYAIERAPAKRAKKAKRQTGKSGARRPITAKAGDTLSGLAQLHEISGGPLALAKANDLRRGAKLRDGQQLRLP